MSASLIATLSIFAATFVTSAIIVALGKHANKQGQDSRGVSLVQDTTPQYDRMLRIVAKRHQGSRRFPIRNERQEDHYMKESLAALHAAHFHDHG